jgi:hypothetical protein
MGSRIFSFFSIIELRNLEKISQNDFLKLMGEKITLRETHSSIQKFPNLFIYFQICQGGPQKKKKTTGSWDASKPNYGSNLLLSTEVGN